MKCARRDGATDGASGHRSPPGAGWMGWWRMLVTAPRQTETRSGFPAAGCRWAEVGRVTVGGAVWAAASAGSAQGERMPLPGDGFRCYRTRQRVPCAAPVGDQLLSAIRPMQAVECSMRHMYSSTRRTAALVIFQPWVENWFRGSLVPPLPRCLKMCSSPSP